MITGVLVFLYEAERTYKSNDICPVKQIYVSKKVFHLSQPGSGAMTKIDKRRVVGGTLKFISNQTKLPQTKRRDSLNKNKSVKTGAERS